MKFTVSWLKKHVDVDMPVSDLADRLTMLGLEVDSVEELFSGLANVLVARVDSVAKHPNADKLSLCQVSIGSECKTVVCGAPNVRVGMFTAIALPGAVLPGGFKIKPSKIRGEASEGMLCSAKELEISDDSNGILDLPNDLEIGQELAKALELADTLVEIDLTPNRPDCASVVGIAREVAGFTGQKLYKLGHDINSKEGSTAFSVRVDEPDLCPRYAARLLKNIQIGPSPWWLQRILMAVGLRPINSVVDITNFVMLELGQPLHAFDFSKIDGDAIVVRKAKESEKITTLDGVVRELESEMLLICDAEKPLAVAGVMGGSNSEVSTTTTQVLLESAYFEPTSIRRTSRRLNLGSDASYRFERGIDPQGTLTALNRAAQLMVEICGAEYVEGSVDVCPVLKEMPVINLRTQRVSDILGVDFSAQQLADFLNGIEVSSTIIDPGNIEVKPPSFRVDLEREIDLIEEIARLYGYNEIPTTMPAVPLSYSEQEPARQGRHKLAGIMTTMGYVEAINYSFASSRSFDMLGLPDQDDLRQTITILNPLSEDQGIMRSTLIPGLLENVHHNLNRQNVDLRMFEIGKVFHPVENQVLPTEISRLTAMLTGRRHPESSLLHYGEQSVDILDVVGSVSQIFEEFQLDAPEFSPGTAPEYADSSSFLAVMCGSEQLGGVGKFAKSVMDSFSIKQDLFFIDIDVSKFLNMRAKLPIFTPLSRFPSVTWDLAVIVPETVASGELIAEILSSKKKYIENAEIFDIYQGKPIQKGYKSVAIKITYHSDTQTLDDTRVGKIQEKIINLLLKRFDAQLREM